jgi:excinuclease ABC subunit A
VPIPDPHSSIRLHGVRQNNLKGFDVNIPLGKLTVVTGLSGAGKSSLVFETLHAEGQRRYVETFSAYTRQFLELLNRPKVDSVENIRPSIAIEQTNTVKTSRSTVGTMTELTDYFKVWFPQVARLHDPDTGAEIRAHSPSSVCEAVLARHAGKSVLVTWRLRKPDSLLWQDILNGLAVQGFTRILSNGSVLRVDAQETADAIGAAAEIDVVQDRIDLSDTSSASTRLREAAEQAFRLGRRVLWIHPDSADAEPEVYHEDLVSTSTGRMFKPASPALFSFNHPIGACPRCRGFGRVIEIDYRLAIPDGSKSIEEDAIRAFEGEVYRSCKKDLLRWAPAAGVRTNVAWNKLTERERNWILNGDPAYVPSDDWPGCWYGLKGFFDWLEKKAYKMHVRVFLSRFRAYRECPDCGGARLQPESLLWKWQGRTLPELYSLPVSELSELLSRHASATLGAGSSDPCFLALQAILTRLGFLVQVGLGYLTLNRSSRTLSGGEVERVNLTSCLGTSIVDALFVLDEPSVGLHPRDINQLTAVLRRLADQGNTVVVVEHDESIMRAADHLIEIGPQPGARGGHLTAQGDLQEICSNSSSITGDYLSGRRQVPVPASRRKVDKSTPRLRLRGVSCHNLRDLDFEMPLNRLVCLSGVSGSGKSTLLNNGIHQVLLARAGLLADEPAKVDSVELDMEVGVPILVDQSPVSRTPRSNPALFTGAWERIRNLYAATPDAQEAGFTASHFSFNSGDGRCEHCKGLGYERVEMQFLADVFVPCPICETRRFKPEVLSVRLRGKPIDALLAMTVTEAANFLGDDPEIRRRLTALEEVGLGYLALGQPLNTLSGGESQRLKLVRHLTDVATADNDEGDDEVAGPHAAGATARGRLLLLDEPTTGLHFEDVRRLVDVLQRLVDRGHSVLLIEHNLEVLKCADWIVEIGPEAGTGGGRIVAADTPERVARLDTATAPFLRESLAGGRRAGSIVPRVAEEAPALRPHALMIRGARENNLRDLSVDIPHGGLTVVTGVSGSGKSTLAFDIVFGEGQRRFMESMSPYARQFVEQMARPAVDRILGIPPTVAIEQRITRGSRKSTVATITEVAQYLRLMYARVGVQHHPRTGKPVLPQTAESLEGILASTLRSKAAREAQQLYLCAPMIRRRKGHHEPIAKWLRDQGFELMRVDGQLVEVSRFRKLDRYSEHDIEAVIVDLKSRAGGARGVHPGETVLAAALRLGKGSAFLLDGKGGILRWFSTTRTDPETGDSFPELDPKDFSFNSPKGWCKACRGHGRIFDWMRGDDGELPPEVAELVHAATDGDEPGHGDVCPSCNGSRLNPIASAVKLPFRDGSWLSLPELLSLTGPELLKRLANLELDKRARLLVADMLPQIEERLRFLAEVGLDYLTLDRAATTLSGGEAQRIRLAAQLGSNLTGVLYVMDEPSIGLHPRDNEALIRTMHRLRDKGNTLLVVEHDDAVMEQADHIIDLGPGAGIHGGRLLAQGSHAVIKNVERSLTGRYLAQGIPHPIQGKRRSVIAVPKGGKKQAVDAPKGWLRLEGARFRNLKSCDLEIPLGRLVVVCGVSGAGKSTLIRDLLRPAVASAIRSGKDSISGREFSRLHPVLDGTQISDTIVFDRLVGAGGLKSVLEVDQDPIGKTPRSTPATYLGAFDLIRDFFATLPEAKMRGYKAGRFSFNTAGGRCESCQGAGRVKLEMNFLPDTYVTCDACRGGRYGQDIAELRWRGRNISEVLSMTFEEAAEFFSFHSQLRDMMGLMVETGLGYLALGQSSPTLSGGEAQRLKLTAELIRGLPSFKERNRGASPNNLYILEEPTIGLHLSDCEKLIRLLHRMVDQGHTVVVIEHHLDIIAEADWLVEVGPEAGPDGGEILFAGTPEKILNIRRSRTAPYLSGKLKVKDL